MSRAPQRSGGWAHQAARTSSRFSGTRRAISAWRQSGSCQRRGNLIGAPVRPVALIDIASTFQRVQYVDGRFIPQGVAHGSEVLPAAEDGDNLEVHLAKDDNATRVPAIMALWDWCLGSDEQWLFDLESHRAAWSYDHGLWLTGESEWTSETLRRVVDRPWEMTLTFRGDRQAFAAVAERLDAVTVDDCLRVAASVPASWPISKNDLESVAWLLYRRRPGVAARLRKRI